MSLMVWLIIGCEIAFWIVIISGLVVRYLLKLPKLGLFLLALTPVVDIILLIATSVDLYRGAVATTAHAIAAVYIGVSIAYGKSMIEWADQRFKFYVTKQGPRPARRSGMDYAVHYLKGWVRHVIAYVIGAGILAGVIFFIHDPSRTEAMNGVLKIWTIVLGIDLIISISYFIWPKEKRNS